MHALSFLDGFFQMVDRAVQVPDVVGSGSDGYSPSLHARIVQLMASRRRVILGLCGPPAAGKSTVAEAIVRHWGDRACLVPMDGFHLADDELARLGRSQRKGAPDTFDAWGYLRLLERLRHQAADECIYAPQFHRDLEAAVAGSIAVAPHVPLIVTEGNYLLLDDDPWRRVPPLLDEVWYVGLDERVRLERLLARHVHYGRSRHDAMAWIESSDQPNARLIEASRARATLQVERPAGQAGGSGQ